MKTLNRKSLKFDIGSIPKMIDLKVFVENINANPDIALRSGVFKGLEHDKVFKRDIDGWEVGYKIEDHGLYCERKVFLKCEQELSEVPDEEKTKMFATVCDVFLERGESIPEIEQIALDAVLITQNFMPLIQTELNPHLRSKGRQLT